MYALFIAGVGGDFFWDMRASYLISGTEIKSRIDVIH
jgi:hypothetical protein